MITPAWPDVTRVSCGVLLEWVRNNAPDLRIVSSLTDGRQTRTGRLTFRGRVFEFAVTAGPQADGSTITDADDAAVRICYEAVACAMGKPLPGKDRYQREREILSASMRGDTELADRLGRELAIDNENETRARRAGALPYAR